MAFLCFMPGYGLPVPPAAGSPFGIRGVDPRRFGKERLYL